MKFWRHRNWLSCLLLPLSWLYRGGSFLKEKCRSPVIVPVPVLCVGNLTLGGAGKTPVVLALARLLQEQGETPHILTRGYIPKRYQCQKPATTAILVEQQRAEEVGDEALLLSQVAPTWVSRDRVLSANAAIKAGASVLILDDGLQNSLIYKDLSFVVIDQLQGLGNGRVFPAGPLRETPRKGLRKAQAVVWVGETPFPEVASLLSALPVFCASIAPGALQLPASFIEKNFQKVVGFAGIGFPEKFRQTLKELEKKFAWSLEEFLPFPDHHVYSLKDLEKLYELAKNTQSLLLTTQKDWVRLRAEDQRRIGFVPMTLEFATLPELRKFLSTLKFD